MVCRGLGAGAAGWSRQLGMLLLAVAGRPAIASSQCVAVQAQQRWCQGPFTPLAQPPCLTCTRHCPSPLPSRRARAVEAAAAQHSRVGGLQHPGRSNGGAHHPPLPSVTAPARVLPRQLPPTACQPAAPHCTDVALLPAGQPAQPCMYRLSSLRCSPVLAAQGNTRANLAACPALCTPCAGLSPTTGKEQQCS